MSEEKIKQQEKKIGAGRKKITFKKFAVGVAILLCGMLLGSALTIHAGNRIMLEAIGKPEKMADHMTRRLTRDLDLSESQKQQVGEIINKRAKSVSGILSETHPRMEEQFELMHREVREVLDDNQKKKFDGIYQGMKEKFERHRPDK